MKKLIAALFAFFCLHESAALAGDLPLDYDQLVILDAEELAEAGIKNAYEKLKPILRAYVAKPAEITEHLDNDVPSYSVTAGGITYDIYSPRLPDAGNEAWGRATYAFFAIVNNQLKHSPVKFYAINGGNELGGMFLTEAQVAGAKKDLKTKTDWPYLPTLEGQWYGQYH